MTAATVSGVAGVPVGGGPAAAEGADAGVEEAPAAGSTTPPPSPARTATADTQLRAPAAASPAAAEGANGEEGAPAESGDGAASKRARTDTCTAGS